MEKFTVLQMKCLLTWSSFSAQSRSITSVAIKMKVSRTAVRKALNAAMEQGILDQEYEVTAQGAERIKAWRHQYQLLMSWMRLHHIDESEWDDVFTLMTEMGPSFKRAMVQESLLCSICRDAKGNSSRCFRGIDLSNYLLAGKYEVRVEFQKMNQEGALSMANRAFARPVYLVVGEKESQIVLKRLKIMQFSPERQKEVGGMMRSLQYHTDGQIKTIRAEEEIVKIPTSDIEWNCSEKDGTLTGRLAMTFTCTAGFHQKGSNQAIMSVDVVGDRN